MMESPVAVYTIGHSNHSLKGFLQLLKQYDIEMVVDVRSKPYSRYVPHFAKKTLQSELEQQGVKYLYSGRKLGGFPQSPEFYDEKGRVKYEKLADASFFQDGITFLEKEIYRERTAVMCSEENPLRCHRHLLLAGILQEKGIEVYHIRGNGSIQSYEETFTLN